ILHFASPIMEFENLISKLIRELCKLGQWLNLTFSSMARFSPLFDRVALSQVTLTKAEGGSNGSWLKCSPNTSALSSVN
ncbi:MAG: hypothetical protein P8176_14720, partial [Gammaproteobacteria bacterium]